MAKLPGNVVFTSFFRFCLAIEKWYICIETIPQIITLMKEYLFCVSRTTLLIGHYETVYHAKIRINVLMIMQYNTS